MRRRRAVYRYIDNTRHKLCTGPTHKDGSFVPMSGFYSRKRSRGRMVVSSECKECEGSRQGSVPMVPYERVKFAVEELVSRLGKAEASRRIGITQRGLWRMQESPGKNIRRITAKKIIVALHEARQKDEVRHRDSIRHGAAARGRAEREVTRRTDLYQPKTKEQIEEHKASERARSLARRRLTTVS